MTEWLYDETEKLDADQARLEVDPLSRFEEAEQDPLAVAIRNVRILDTKRLFGAAKIRLDALFVTVPGSGAGVSELYAPSTLRFDGIRPGDTLQIDDEAKGLLLYLGHPNYFLDIAIAASRAEDDQPDLGELLSERADDIAKTLGSVGQLAAGLPVVGGITAAASAAAQLSGLFLGILTKMTGRSIGLYRTTWFQNRDKFGHGIHPSDGLRFRKNDLEFSYEVFRDTPLS